MSREGWDAGGWEPADLRADWSLLGLGLDGANESRGQADDAADELKDAVDCDADEAEGQGQEPDHGVQDEGKQGQRPAEE